MGWQDDMVVQGNPKWMSDPVATSTGAATAAPPGDVKTMTTGEFVAGLPITRLAMGAASPLIAAAQIGAHVGDEINKATGVEPVVGPYIEKKMQEFETAKKRGMEGRGNGGYDWMGLLGSMVPSGKIASEASNMLPQASNTAARMAVGGAATAVAQPSAGATPDFFADKAKQAIHGGAFGAAIPAVPQAALAGKAVIEPFYEKGREQIIGRALRAASGGKADDVVQALLSARELVKDSLPTVGQASQNAGVASLERAAGAISPESTVAFHGREVAQNAARAAALKTVAGDENLIMQAVQARKAATSPLISQLDASTAAVDPARTVSLIDNLIAKSPGRKQLTSTLQEVKESLFTPEGELRSNASQLYQGARKNITDLLNAKAGDGSKLNEAISRELSVVMKSLDHQINKAEPAYGQFLSTYAEKSKPINQMQIGQEIEKKATNAVGNVNLNPLTAALSDKTAQRATGFKRATLEGTMTPEQLNTLNSVKEDLIRAVQARNMAGTAGSDTVKKLAYTNLIDQAGVPTFLREFAPAQVAGNLAARGADTLYSKANQEIAAKLAEAMLDPKLAARMMQAGAPSRYAATIDALIQPRAKP